MLACVELGLDDTPTASLESVGSHYKSLHGVEYDRTSRESRVKGLFHFLRERKSVKRIVRVVVHDHPQAPCRDDVIKTCLQEFDVRYLDWDKEDLSVDMLQDVAPQLQELWLTWSGRKSALHGWSNREYGLPQLKKVRCFKRAHSTRCEKC